MKVTGFEYFILGFLLGMTITLTVVILFGVRIA